MAGVMIRTFLADGTPDGLRTFEVSNSTVHATVFPRPTLDRFLKREAAQRPGVYVLVGQDPESDATRLYIGEGDPTEPRLRAHGVKKDFWTQAAVFTSKDDYLTKTQVQFLEARLVAETKSAGRVVLDNGNVPNEPRISEADQAEVEVFVYRNKDAEARLVRTPTAYLVLRGSTASADSRPSAQQWIRKLREELLASAILVPGQAGLLRFAKDAELESVQSSRARVLRRRSSPVET